MPSRERLRACCLSALAVAVEACAEPAARAPRSAEAALNSRGPAPRLAPEAPTTPEPPAPAAPTLAMEASPAPEAPPAAPAAAEVPQGTTVLHVGDSFAGALGPELNRLFKTAGMKGVLRYKTSSYIPTWAWDKELGALLRQYRPDLVLVTLGANELKIEDPEERIPTIKRLVRRLGDRPCVWIAPPLWEAAEKRGGGALLDVIRDHCAPCVYMDTNRLISHMDRARDAIHPAPEARAEWAALVYDWLRRHRRTDGRRPWELGTGAGEAELGSN